MQCRLPQHVPSHQDSLLIQSLILACKIIFSEYGLPKKIMSDTNSNFILEKFHEFYKSMNTEEPVLLSNHQKLKLKVIYIYIVPSSGDALSKALYMQLLTPSSGTINYVIPFCEGATSSHLNSLGSIQATRLPLGAVTLFGMHIIPPFTITAGTQGLTAQHLPLNISLGWLH